MNDSTRAKWKICTAVVAAAILNAVLDLDHFERFNTIERAIQIGALVGKYVIALILPLKVAKIHRLWGFMMAAGVAIILTIGAASLVFGVGRMFWLSLFGAAVFGWGAYVFLLDQDVRRFREEHLQPAPDCP